MNNQIVEFTAERIADILDIAQKLREEYDGKPLWWRGQVCADWLLQPSCYRRFQTVDQVRTCLSLFKMEAVQRHANCPDRNDWPGWLTLAQHFGVPTPLLDWSTALLVACYFATENTHPSADALIWALRPARMNELLGVGSNIRMTDKGDFTRYLRRWFHDEPVLDEAYYALIGSQVDMRMMIQSGAFTLHDSPRPLEDHSLAHEFLTKVRIPQHARAQMAAEVKILGMDRGTIYPDLGNLAVALVERVKADEHSDSPPGKFQGSW